MKEKIISIREKYNWDSPFKIIRNKNASKRDRLFLSFMYLWYIPTKILLSIVWLILYYPSRLFYTIDDILN
jgi:hypothetical protein